MGPQSGAVEAFREGIVGFIGRVTNHLYGGCILLEGHHVEMFQRHQTAANKCDAYSAKSGIYQIGYLSRTDMKFKPTSTSTSKG